MVYRLLRPLLFTIDAEQAHGLAIRALQMMPQGRPRPASSSLSTEMAGINFPNPLGMAAGFDKDGKVPDALLGLGFGFAEVGSITPLPQAGNAKPRVFRLVEDRGVINRLGFNNDGAEAAFARLAARKARGGIIGVNIGANKDSTDRVADYAHMARFMAPVASYLTVNISSPNTPGLRALQDESVLADLLDAVMDAHGQPALPVFLKVAPDLEAADVDAIARIAMDKKIGALIISNTTISRPPLRSGHAHETGGLSGAPLCIMAHQRLKDFRKASGGALPLIGVGGITTAENAWSRIRAGASLIQLYSAMVFEGPGIAKRILRDLEKLMIRDGFVSIAEAVGTE